MPNIPELKVGDTTYDLHDKRVDDLKSALNDRSIEGIFSIKNWPMFGRTYIDKDTGEEKYDDPGYSASDYIPISKDVFAIVPIVAMPYGKVYNAFYNENKEFVARLEWTINQHFIPSNAKYFRVSTSRDAISSLKFKVYTYDEWKATAESTIGFQGSLTYVRRDEDKALIVTGENNPYGNFLFIRNFADSRDVYATVKNTYIIPRYASLVLSLKDCANSLAISSSPKPTLVVKSYSERSNTDIDILVNCGNSTGYSIGGIWADQKRFYKVDNIDDAPLPAHNDDTIMRSICRFGEAYGSPETPDAIRNCYNAGFNIIRLNLLFTRDNVPVLWHDQYLSQHYHNVWDLNGNLVVYTAETGIAICDKTLSELNQYRFGRSTATPGIPQLEPALAMCRKLGMEVVLEGKMSYTAEQIQILYSLIGKYGMIDKTSIAAGVVSNATLIAQNAPSLRIGLQSSTLDSQTMTTYQELSQISKRLFWWGWNTFTLTKEAVDFITQYGIEYECGDFESYSAIDNYLSSEYAYRCTGMEIKGSISPLVGQYIKNKVAT